MNDDMKKRIMRRVYMIYAVRAAISFTACKVYAIGVIVWGITNYISFRHVFGNAPKWNDVGAQYAFISSAVVHTETAVWILMFTFACFMLWVARDMSVRGLTPAR